MESAPMSVNELAQVCAHSSDAAEWQEFLRRTTPLTTLVVARVARLWINPSPPALIDDIVQEVYLKLCEQERRVLRDFVPRREDSFFGLLRIVAASVANDYFRRLYSAKRGGKVITTQFGGDGGPGPASSAGEVEEVQRSVLFGQMDRLLRAAPDEIGERDRNLFWLYYLQGLTAVEIASLPAMELSAKGVESAVRRVAVWLRQQIESRRAECGLERTDGVGMASQKEI
jgi:RNA polymerase sigma-70 factor, ECF subfamily